MKIKKLNNKVKRLLEGHKLIGCFRNYKEYSKQFKHKRWWQKLLRRKVKI